jgi:hypothetical protein
MVYPPAKPILWNENVVDPTVLEPYALLIELLLNLRNRFTPDEPGIVRLTPEAHKLIIEFQNQRAIDSLGIANTNIRYVENKAGMHCARICLVLHVIKCVENDVDPVSPVTVETMEQAIALTEWFLNEAHRIYAMFAGKEEPRDDLALIITTIIRKCGGEARVADFRNRSRRIKKFVKTEALKAKLEEMVNAGFLTFRIGERNVLFYRMMDTTPANFSEDES